MPGDPVAFDPYFNGQVAGTFENLGWHNWWGIPAETWPFYLSWAPTRYNAGCLAESWDFGDYQTITIHLRKGVRFHDIPPVNGREMTAYDVEYSFHRLLGLGHGFTKPTPYVSLEPYLVIASVTATDRYTVVFKFSTPSYYTATVIMHTNKNEILPQDALEKWGDLNDWRRVIGTGPFMLIDYVADSGITLKRNADYYLYDEKNPKNKLPYADFTKVLIIPDPSTRFSALRTGKIDRLNELAWQDGENLIKTTPGLQYRSQLAASPRIFQIRTDIKPLNDVRVRQALSMAIDRNEMIKSFFNGNAYYYSAWLAPLHGSLHTPYDKLPDKPKWTTMSAKDVLTYNPTKAKQLLADAGYPNGFKTVIDTTAVRDPGLSELLQSYFSKIGVDAQINMMDSAVYDVLARGKKSGGIIVHWLPVNPDPSALLAYFANPNHIYDYSMVNDPWVTDTFNKAVREFDDTKRGDMLKQIEYWGIENAIYLLLPHNYEYTVWQPWIGGYAGEGAIGTSNYSPLFANIGVDQKLKASVMGH